MVRTVFFSFHYDEDSWRASQVRNSDVVQSTNIDSSGFIDGAEWEEVKQDGDAAIRRWIRKQMKGCSVTVLLIGSNTYGREWIDYEIEKSVEEGMGIVGVRIHNIKDQDKKTAPRGRNPLKKWKLEGSGESLSTRYQTYDWVGGRGRENLGEWIEEAAAIANR